uniref:Major facilitator superfamily (MFS) profile domain-containing protein n=1 Tax=Anopheles stephensi TaxID=30069 RepID=A0A182YFN8_ANOST
MEEGRSDSVYSSGEEDLFAKQSLMRLRNAARWREQAQYISFEPALLIFCFAMSISEVVLANHIILQTCVVEGFDSSDCQLLNTDSNSSQRELIETKVQPIAANITMVIVIIKSVVPALSALLLGAWSDRYGRKPTMLIASVGVLCSFLLLTVLTFLSMQVTVTPWYYTAAYLPFSLLGGMTVITAAAFSYLSDVTNEQTRTMRMGFMEASMMTGALLGFLSSSYILEWLNVAATFAIATVLIALAIVYVIYCTEDSIILSNSNSTWEKLRDLLSCERLRELSGTFFMRRSGYVREILWAIVLLTALTELAGGSGGVFYMFTRRKFGWDLKQFSYFQFADVLTIILGNVIGIPILKQLLHCSDTTVAIVSIASYIADSLIMGFATSGWMLYLAISITVLKGTDGAALMTICSTILPAGDMAKFFTMALSLTAVVPLLSAPLFTFVYNSTIQFAPEIFNFIAAGFFGVGLLLMLSEQTPVVDLVTEPTAPTLERKYRFFILEPAVFLIFFAWNVSSAVFANQIVYQTCTAAFGKNESLCERLGTENETEEIQQLEKSVQPYSANILMTKSLVESIVPALCSMFIGPWSDRFGRKPVIVASFTGAFLTYSTVTLISFLSMFYTINPWFYVLASIPVALSGGTCALITGVFCYIADVTQEKNRATKMAVVEAALFTGLLAGTLSSSFILRWTNGTTVFAIAAGAVFLGLMYNVFYIEESIQPNELSETNSKFRELFRFESVGELMRTCFKRRPNYDRLIIWLVILALGADIFALDGSQTVFLLFLRERFEWTVKDYSYYDATSIVFMIFGNTAGLYLIRKLFNLSVTMLAALGFCCYAINSTIHGLASEPWQLYMGVAICFMKGIAGPMSRAVISNTAPASDIGKIFSLTTSIESITPLFSAPLYTFVYKSTLSWYPGAFNLITATVYFTCACLLIFARIFQSMQQTTTYTSIN